MSRGARRRRRIVVSDAAPPDITWDHFFLADTFDQADNSTISTSWAPTYGSTSLTVAGTPTYRTGQAIWNGKPYIELSGNDDVFYGALGNITQGFVVVMGLLLTAAPAASRLIFDSYTDGTLPANRAFWQYFDTAVDESRISAGSTLSAQWSTNIGYNTEGIAECIYAGATSSQKWNGTEFNTGNAGANTMDGISVGQYTGPTTGSGVCETMRYAFVGRISKTNWDAGRASFVSWFNTKYGEAAS